MKKQTYKERKADSRYLNINVNGNMKLKNNDSLRFMIWNLPAVKTCPFATKHCKAACYALKAERQYPDCRFSRASNLKRSQRDDFVSNMIYTIETELDTPKFKGKQVVFRIHESGDFYNLAYTAKWLEIARHFENTRNLVFMAYTKSIGYFVELGYNTPNFPDNLVIISSVWDDTPCDKLELTGVYGFPVYTALAAQELEQKRMSGDNFTECRCEDCATCGKCWAKGYEEIIVAIH